MKIRQVLASIAAASLGLALVAVPFSTGASAETTELTNLALKGTATASGRELPNQWGPELAIDGNKGGDLDFREVGTNFRSSSASRWSANAADQVWLAVDLGGKADVSRVEITWGKQFATKYSIQVSDNGTDWRNVKTDLVATASADQSTDVTTDGKATAGRYWRVLTQTRNSTFPIGIWEFEVFGVLTEQPQPAVELPSVIPQPVSYQAGDGGAFTLTSQSQIVASGDAADEAELFAEGLRKATGFELPLVAQSEDKVADIHFTISSEAAGGEGYTVVANAQGVTVASATTHGLFNGAQTLRQLFGPWAFNSNPTNGPWTFPALNISDTPRFEYRSMMLDPARSFLTVDEVKEAIDAYSMMKMNYLHLHLADDQGWRIEITNEGRAEGDTIDYTLLTSVSGKTAVGTTDWNTAPGVAGFYTQEDLRDIVAYATKRHVSIIPEIDVPAHTQAILHAIPQLNTAGSSHDGTNKGAIKDPTKYQTAPANETSAVGYSYLDPEAPATWTFISHVVDQINAITHSGYFHFGGDETHQMNTDHGASTYNDFVTRVATLIRDKGLTPIGWNEAAGGTQKDGDVIQVWNGGVGDAVTQGAKVIFSNAGNTYYPQRPAADIAGPNWACGGAYCGIDKFYNYNPNSVAGSDEKTLGVEGAMWNEHMRSIQDIFFIEFPRAAATAEVAWTPQAQRKVADFRERLTDFLPALSASGVDFYSGDSVNVDPQIAGVDTTQAEASKQVPIGYGYSPATTLGGVSAQVTWALLGEDGQAGESENATVSVSQMREYLAGTSANHNNRQQNGLFTLSAQAPQEPGTYQGTVTFSVGGKTVSDTVTLTVPAEPVDPGTTPDGLDAKPSGDPSKTGSTSVSRTQSPSQSTSDSASQSTSQNSAGKAGQPTVPKTGASVGALGIGIAVLLAAGTVLALRRRYVD